MAVLPEKIATDIMKMYYDIKKHIFLKKFRKFLINKIGPAFRASLNNNGIEMDQLNFEKIRQEKYGSKTHITYYKVIAPFRADMTPLAYHDIMICPKYHGLCEHKLLPAYV